MGRISRASMFMMMARASSMRSTCMRLNVGAVVVYNNRVVSHGYNGAPAGEEHCTGNECPGALFCTRTIHAEVNAITRVPEELRGADLDLYTTHSPCVRCCDLILWSSIRRVFFEVPYRETGHLKKYAEHWDFYEVTPAGYVVEYFSRQVAELA